MDQRFSLGDMPIYFKIGSVGAVGQAVAGISSGLGQVGGFLGGAGSGVREAVRRQGVKGLDAGLGCGVGVGYGFGAGLFLKPSAAEQLVRLVEDAAGILARHAQATLQQAGLTLSGGGRPGAPQPAPLFAQHVTQHLPPGGNGGGIGSSLYGVIGSQDPAAPQQPYAHQPLGAGPLRPLSASAWQQQQQQQQQQATQTYHATAASLPPAPSPGESAFLPAHASTSAAASTSSTTTSQAPSSQAGSAREPSAEEFRALLRHERQIARLRAQNRALRSAVCKLDRRLPICKETSDDDDENGGVGGW